MESRVGERWGYWVVTKDIDYEHVEAHCTHCNKTTKVVWYRHLKRGKSTSCGCASKQLRLSKKQSKLHGNIQSNDITDQFECIMCRLLDNIGIKYQLHCNIQNVYVNILIPDKQLAISFHKTLDNFTKHHNKRAYFEQSKVGFENNIRIIHIFEHEWLNKSLAIKILQLINDTLGNTKVIYARETKCIEVQNRSLTTFMNEHHLQGAVGAKIAYVLTYNGEIVSAATFGKCRYDNSADYEIIRTVNKGGYSILGGTSKLLKHFIRDYDVQSIVSYSDISKFTGRSYIKTGLKFVGFSDPGYVWVKDSEVINRQRVQKHKLLEKGLGYEWETENDIMIRLGYNKVYNCGNAKFLYNR